ncbi:accessory Sec system S-layer assembly protein [Halalkalibacter urbisdiaboli]|uniref:accessory Sec system S-layer assembly protein n=1 Tax=Halalkalibacter urbisdiaboli TaxID=1960589 RepID=UPI000B44B120|nr:accessory Sec system S-layer assembly protein [Halalkalibacter urbisdiaboli]
MIPFFNKNKDNKPKLEGQESAVSSEDLLNEVGSDDDESVQTDLSIHPDWNIAKEDQYAFQFLNMECPPLKPSQLSLAGISLMQDGEHQYRVTAFIRNSLDKTIELGEMNLVLMDENEKILGRKLFNLKEVGELPPRSSRPWYFTFSAKDLFTTELPTTGWTLAFLIEEKNTDTTHRLDLAPAWKQSLNKASKQQLEKIVADLEPPKEGEVNLMGLQAKQTEEGELHVTMLIRNGSDQNVNLEQLPLHVEDATGELVAQGSFKLEDFVVKANTTKPWTFIYPKSLVQKQQPDLSKWKAFTPNA